MNVSGQTMLKGQYENRNSAKFISVYKSTEFSLQNKSADLHQVRMPIEGT